VEKLPFGITQEFVDEINSSSSEDLKSKMISLQKYLVETESELSINPHIQKAKTELKIIAGPYQDTRRALRNKLKLSVKRLEEIGA
jgi:hypothetical protein